MPLQFTGGNGPTSGFGVRANFWVLNFMSINFKTNQGTLTYEGYSDATGGLTSYSPLYNINIPIGATTYSEIMGNILDTASTTAAYLHNFFDNYVQTVVTGPSGEYSFSLTGATVVDFDTSGGGLLDL
jgi:hypothetical protein